MYRGRRRQPAELHRVQGGVRQSEPYRRARTARQRDAGDPSLDPSRTYFWKATWGSEFRLVVRRWWRQRQFDLRPGVSRQAGRYAGAIRLARIEPGAFAASTPARSRARLTEISGSATNRGRRRSATRWTIGHAKRQSGGETMPGWLLRLALAMMTLVAAVCAGGVVLGAAQPRRT